MILTCEDHPRQPSTTHNVIRIIHSELEAFVLPSFYATFTDLSPAIIAMLQAIVRHELDNMVKNFVHVRLDSLFHILHVSYVHYDFNSVTQLDRLSDGMTNLCSHFRMNPRGSSRCALFILIARNVYGLVVREKIFGLLLVWVSSIGEDLLSLIR